MATRSYTSTEIRGFYDHAHKIVWSGLLNGDDGDPVAVPGAALKTIQFTGTFGVGGTIVLEGSVDGTNYVTLTDLQGNNISKTAAALEGVQEFVFYVRPRVTAGDGSTDLAAHLAIKRV
jgi:hypothetical protein